MLEKQIVSAWNAVNVCSSDGMLQRGLVVDTTDSRLLIDFGVPDKEPELFSVDRVFSYAATISSLAPGGDIFFLYQLSPQHPWTWYPAKIVAASDGVFVLVDFAWENVRIRDMFPWRRFQGFYPYPYNGPHLVQFHEQTPNFSKTAVPLPDGLQEKDRFIDLWRHDLWMHVHIYPVDIEGNQFSYIYDSQHHEQELVVELVPHVFDTAHKMASLDTGQHGRFCSCNAQRATASEEMSITDLPLDIMTDIFSYMHCIDLTRLRRMCIDWNDIIGSLPSEIVMVDLGVFSHWNMAVSLHKFLTSHTKYVLFVGDDNSPDNAVIFGRSHTGTLLQLANQACNKLKAIVVSQAVIAEDFVPSDDDAVFSKQFQAICGRVILVDVCCKLYHYFEGIPGTTGKVEGPDMFITYCEFDASDKSTALPDAFEDCHSAMPDFVLDLVANFLEIAGVYGQAGESHLWLQKALLQVIKKRQPNDPRFSPDCSWMHVEAALLHHVDSLRTLRNSTLKILLSVISHFAGLLAPEVSND